ncbi:transposase, partial [Vibrio splendidus]
TKGMESRLTYRPVLMVQINLYRGVLPDKSIISATEDQVSFEYQNSQTKATEIRTLPTVEFLWLVLQHVLQHVLPKGLRRVRDYGLLQGSCRKLRLQIQLMLAVAGTMFAPFEKATKTQAIRPCPCCQQPMIFMGVHARLTSFIMHKTREPNATV